MTFAGKTLFSITIVTALASSSYADSKTITIKDCDSKIRLSENISDEAVNVFAKLADTSEAQSVSLIKSDSATRLSKDIKDKQVVLENVTAGNWTLCSDTTKIAFKEIKIVKGGLSTASVAGLSIAAAGGLGIALGSSGSSNTETRVVETKPQVTEPITENNIQEVVNDAANSVNKPIDKCKDKNVAGARASGPCFIGEDDDVTPISPFS